MQSLLAAPQVETNGDVVVIYRFCNSSKTLNGANGAVMNVIHSDPFHSTLSFFHFIPFLQGSSQCLRPGWSVHLPVHNSILQFVNLQFSSLSFSWSMPVDDLTTIVHGIPPTSLVPFHNGLAQITIGSYDQLRPEIALNTTRHHQFSATSNS